MDSLWKPGRAAGLTPAQSFFMNNLQPRLIRRILARLDLVLQIPLRTLAAGGVELPACFFA